MGKSQFLDWHTIMNMFSVIAYDRGKSELNGKRTTMERYTLGRKLTKQQYDWLMKFGNVKVTKRYGNHTIYLRS